jgi:hypothetical protein
LNIYGKEFQLFAIIRIKSMIFIISNEKDRKYPKWIEKIIKIKRNQFNDLIG